MRAVRTTTISILALGLLAGSAVGVAAQDDAADPISSFYGSLVEETDSGFVIEMSDSRASGELSFVETRTELRDDKDVDNVSLTSNSVRLINENGSWSGTKMDVGTAWGVTWTSDYLLTGAGGYEGLMMMLGSGTLQGDDYWGAIFPTDAIPPFPELSAE